jgi:glycosyltransferase involved in cell wall biosynthesis
VIETDWPGFGPQRNRALQHATTDWILFLDADEQVSDALKRDLQALLQSSPDCEGYRILRRSSFMGRVIYHGDWRSDYVLRLFKRGKGRYTESAVHERCLVDGKIASIQSIIHHDSVDSLEQALNKMNTYSTLGAAEIQKPTCGVGVAFFHGLWTFVRGFILRRGFLDGREGLLIALLNSGGSFFKYVKGSYRN